MTHAQPPDAMKKLVLLIIGIAILGTIIALGVHYGVELPAQNNLKAPSNAVNPYCPIGTPNCEVPATCQELWPGRCSGVPKPG